MREQIRDRERLRHILAAIERVKRYVQGKTYLSITHIGDGLHAITDVFLIRNLEESRKEVIFANVYGI